MWLRSPRLHFGVYYWHSLPMDPNFSDRTLNGWCTVARSMVGSVNLGVDFWFPPPPQDLGWNGARVFFHASTRNLGKGQWRSRLHRNHSTTMQDRKLWRLHPKPVTVARDHLILHRLQGSPRGPAILGWVWVCPHTQRHTPNTARR